MSDRWLNLDGLDLRFTAFVNLFAEFERRELVDSRTQLLSSYLQTPISVTGNNVINVVEPFELSLILKKFIDFIAN